MPVVVSGSIATDHLMHFPGRFSEQLLAEHLASVSLSFLVDDLVVRRGGVAANIAYGMGLLGGSPVLVGAVGSDFADYRVWLESHGVDCESVHVSEVAQTSRFVCTTDEEMCQIASFYAGAMSEARNISIRPVVERTGADLVLVSAHDPDGMVRHSRECREQGYRLAADPSQQIARLDGGQLLELIEGAELLFTNEYEAQLLESKTGLSTRDVLGHVTMRVRTLGKDGVEITGRDLETVTVPVAKERARVDPTGVGDGFRAGFLTGVEWGLSLERSAQLGSLLATLVLETSGPQEYEVRPAELLDRLAESYGDDAAADVGAHLLPA